MIRLDPNLDFPVGVNLDGVLDHDGLPDPTPARRFARVAASGVFDFVEKNLVVGEDVAPYIDLVAEHGVPIGIFIYDALRKTWR